MKIVTLIIFICLISCTENQKDTVVSYTDTSAQNATAKKDSITHKKKTADTAAATDTINSERKIYSNKRFRNVTIEKAANNKYIIKGEGQIFEASFSWVIEDGHDELQQGYTMTDAGAPEWGKFSFTVEAVKKRPNSTLHIILFEISAKDGSRQYELPIALD